MIKTQTLTPEVYYKESRDFQLFGRLYDVLFNYLKTEIDLIRSFPLNNTQDTSFLELLLRTLGFGNLREYQTNQLIALARCWMSIIRNKGSMKAVEDSVKLILRTQNISNDFNISLDTEDFNGIPTVVIRIRDLISSDESALLEEILNYILPIGVSYVIQDVNTLGDIEPMIITMEESTSLGTASIRDLSTLARTSDDRIGIDLESSISGHTGTFEQQQSDDITKGSIRIGKVARRGKE